MTDADLRVLAVVALNDMTATTRERQLAAAVIHLLNEKAPPPEPGSVPEGGYPGADAVWPPI